MTNDEISMRLKLLSQAIPDRAKQIYGRINGDAPNAAVDEIRAELELLNMSMVAVWSMLGEIAKRLPEAKP